MEVQVDRDRCVAAGLCVLLAPEVFDQADEDGRVLLVTAAPDPELARQVRAAASRCPSGAIRLDAGDQPIQRIFYGDDKRSGDVVKSNVPEMVSRPAVRDFVARLWCEVLNVPAVSDTDHFFELGGHSIAVMNVLETVEREYGVELGMREVWENLTLAGFVALVVAQTERAG